MKKAPMIDQSAGALSEQRALPTRLGSCSILPMRESSKPESSEGLQELAESLGLVLYPVTGYSGSAAFLVARKAGSREFADLAAARHFVEDWAGGVRG